jgi:hypothetical protein
LGQPAALATALYARMDVCEALKRRVFIRREETAQVLGASLSDTVIGAWRLEKAWLRREIGSG